MGFPFGILKRMKIRNVKHKRLRRFFEDDSGAGLPAQYVDKIHKILAFLQDMESVEELQAVPTWKTDQLTGDRKSTWSLFVSKNWRITFRVDEVELEIIDLDYEDYH